MKKYICSICGYVYDEQKESVKFADLPNSWVCPLCGAPKSSFNELNELPTFETPKTAVSPQPKNNDKALTNAELNVMCSNLAKGCEKQYKAEEYALFNEIADYYKKHSETPKENSLDDISKTLNVDLSFNFSSAIAEAKNEADRGALRALVWSEKVSKIIDSLLNRYKKDGTAFLQNTKIFVCEICGFIYIGDEAPEICPICKVPRFKIHEVGRV